MRRVKKVLDIKKEFSKSWWQLFFLVMAIAACVLVLTSVVIAAFSLPWKILTAELIITAAVALAFPILRILNRLDVPANHFYVIEWLGVLYSLNPGRVYPFPWWGRLMRIEPVMSNRVVLSIMLGKKTEKEEVTLKDYVYGTPSNVETVGDYVRLLLKLEIQCINPIKLCSSHEDPYKYIIGLAEIAVRKFAGGVDNDKMDTEYYAHPWKTEVQKIEEEFKIYEKLGLKIHSLVPVDVLNTPEVEEFNRKVQEADQQGRVIEKENLNRVKVEEGTGKVLDVTIKNTDKKAVIASKNNEILKKTIDTVQRTSNTRGEVALKFINDQNRYNTIAEASKGGGIVYIENGGEGNSNASTGAGLTWGINAANSAVQKNTNTNTNVNSKSTKDRDKDKGKPKGPAKGKVSDDEDDDD